MTTLCCILSCLPNQQNNILTIPKRIPSGQTDHMENWRDRARQTMRRLGVSQDKLAEALDMTQGGVQHWLAGTRQPSLEDINRIANVLAVPPAWLTHGLEPDDMLDGLPDSARKTLRRLIHAEREAALPEAIWNIVKSAAELATAASTSTPADKIGNSVSPTLEALLNAKPKTSTRDFAPAAPTATAPHEPSA